MGEFNYYQMLEKLRWGTTTQTQITVTTTTDQIPPELIESEMMETSRDQMVGIPGGVQSIKRTGSDPPSYLLVRVPAMWHHPWLLSKLYLLVALAGTSRAGWWWPSIPITELKTCMQDKVQGKVLLLRGLQCQL